MISRRGFVQMADLTAAGAAVAACSSPHPADYGGVVLMSSSSLSNPT
jgi:hypothetical protein